MNIHLFDDKLKDGKESELEIDSKFNKHFVIRPVLMEAERRGIDRIWEKMGVGTIYTVEYKTDWKAIETGNVFIETVSVDNPYKAGWVFTSQAQLLVYRVPTVQILLVPMTSVKTEIEKWQQEYREVDSENEGYITRGLLVPMAVFETITGMCKQNDIK